MRLERTAVVVGCGEIGKPIFQLSCGGFEQVIAVDPLLDEPEDPRFEVEVLHVAIPGSLPNFDQVVVESIAKYQPGIAIVHSTTVPGTTGRIAESVGPDNIVHAQVHGKHHGNRMRSDMLRYDKFVGTASDVAFNKAKDALIRMGHPPVSVRRLSSPLASELAKLLATTFFGYLIVWAQVVERISNKENIPFEELMSFRDLGTDDYAIRDIFPGHIGGHCVMPNIDLLRSRYPSLLWDFMIESNDHKGEQS